MISIMYARDREMVIDIEIETKTEADNKREQRTGAWLVFFSLEIMRLFFRALSQITCSLRLLQFCRAKIDKYFCCSYLSKYIYFDSHSSIITNFHHVLVKMVHLFIYLGRWRGCVYRKCATLIFHKYLSFENESQCGTSKNTPRT